MRTRFLPLIETHLRPAGGPLRQGWSDERELSVVRGLLRRESPEDIELAIVGFAHLRELGELTFLVKPGENATMLVFNTRSDADSVWNQALHHALKFGLAA